MLILFFMFLLYELREQKNIIPSYQIFRWMTYSTRYILNMLHLLQTVKPLFPTEFMRLLILKQYFTGRFMEK